MVLRDLFVQDLAHYLNIDAYQDYAPNGLQVEGRPDIQRICTAVTASEQVILKAARLGADALLVHHGFFWKGEPSVICGMKKRRISILLQHDINLLGYHLPLDCHADIGNNACIAQKLAVDNVQTHRAGSVQGLLWSGQLPHALEPQQFEKQLSQLFLRACSPVYADTAKPIQHVAWCSGGAQDFIEQAAMLGMDAYISGEISERTYYQAKELGVHYFSCGHHATERFGIQALGERLSQKWDISHEFIDSDNPW